MRIAIGSDHAGFALKEKLRTRLAAEGHELVDFGAHSTESCDYPEFAEKVADEVAAGRAPRGILVCYTGIGMAMAANKVRGVRAAPAEYEEEVRLTRQHNDANVLTLGAKRLSEDQAMDMIGIFLGTEFQGGRHARRVDGITEIEKHNTQATPGKSA